MITDVALTLFGVLDGLGAWGPALVLLAYVVAAVVLIPVFPLTLGLGFLLGVSAGVAVALPGVILGAAATYWLGALVFVRGGRRPPRGPRWQAAFAAIDHGGLGFQILVRASPFIPNALNNYLAPVARIPWWTNLLAVAAGRLPIVLLDLYIGSLARSLVEAVEGGPEVGALKFAIVGLGLAVTLGAGLWAARLLRRPVRR
jgi:uncharacterized membrane protein YdjX (TVP38/TMEM64 family)